MKSLNGNEMNEPVCCPYCQSQNFVKKGRRLSINKKCYRQSYLCRECRRWFKGKNVRITEEFKYIPKEIEPRNWSSYTEAQNNEKLMLMDILDEILMLVESKEGKRRGRPKISKHDIIFSMAMKEHSRLSSRRLISDLKMARDRSLIEHVPHFTSLMHYYESKEITKLLNKLIEISSLPLKEIENTFAIDSTGLSTSVFGRWFDYKFDKESERRQYLKLHLMIGTSSNVAVSAMVTESDIGDSTMFPDLVNDAERNFSIEKVVADKAYLSGRNYAIVEDFGGTAFIPFKSNSRSIGRGRRAIWRKMYHYFHDHKQEFLRSYHIRSRVESSFMALKTKLGSSLKTKTFTAQRNEILARVLIYNICCLVRQYYESNLELVFSTEVAEDKALAVA